MIRRSTIPLSLAIGLLCAWAHADGPKRRVAVLGLQSVRPGAETDAVAKGAALTLTMKLDGAADLAAVSRLQVAEAMQGQRVPGANAAGQSAAVRLGKRLGAERVVIGAVACEGDTLRFKLQVIDVASGRYADLPAVSGPRSETFSTMARLAGEVIRLARAPADGLTAGRVAPSPRPVLPGNRYAVVIGINVYKNRRIPALTYAVSDARAVHNFLVNEAGFPKDNVVLCLGEQATQQNVRSALGTFLARKALKEDTVLIFYAGHGAPETDYARKSPDGLAKYLVPYDAQPDDLYATAIPMTEIATIFKRIDAEKVVFFSDACYSGAAGGRSFSTAKFRGVQIADPMAQLVHGKGRVIITAGGPNEPSVEDPSLGHGVFTYYLLQGLSGQAADPTGRITVHSLYRYLTDRVTRKSKQLGGNQHPILRGETQGDIVLVPGG